ncbi:hypothetical protein TNCV_3760021 [Trichonephila clavipes]|nr:hypothetical protein TNCV_3760021 [Trichonephila clavipes]
MLGVCGGCQLGSSFSVLHTGFGSITNMVSLGDILFSCRVDGTSTFSTYRSTTGSPNFLLIVDKLQTFGCVASPDHRIFFLSIDASTFSTYRSPTGLPNFLLVVEKCQTF